MGHGRGISPVLATVILVAVAIAIAIAVAFWASNITGIFSRTEQIQMEYSYIVAGKNSSGAIYYNITFSCRNVGSADTTIIQAFINGKPLKAFSPTSSVYLNGILWIKSNDTVFREISFPAGSSITLVMMLPSGGPSPITIIPGQVVEVRMETSGGVHYIGTFLIP